jgi:signal transduction histidine kinase
MRPAARRRGTRIGLALVICILIAWCIVMTGFSYSPVMHTEMSKFARDIGTVLFLSAGILRAAQWQLTRDVEKAHSAGALLLIGTALAIGSGMYAVVPVGSTLVQAPVSRLILVLPLAALVIVRLWRDRRAARRCVTAFCAMAISTALGVLVFADAAPEGLAHPAFWIVVELLTTAMWTTLAVQSHCHSRLNGSSGWVASALALMAVADLLTLWTVSDDRAIADLGIGFQTVAALIATATAAVDLVRAGRRDSDQYGELTRELVATQRRLNEVEQRQRQRLHDARSAVLGVAGATALLAESPLAGAVDAGNLRTLMTSELDRLERLLRIEDDEPVVEFDLAEATAAVVQARRLDGLVVDLDLAGVRVIGRPRATATVLDNLLRNAHRHANGTHVLVAARTLSGCATIAVTDDGPGIPPAEREAVLRAGVRGSQARGDGSGFGLYSAARAMAAQDGSLTVDGDACGGTRIVLRMPAPTPAHAMAS